MSHTTFIGTTVFIHNGDFSGDISISAGPYGHQVSVPFDDLAAFVASQQQSAVMSALEGLDLKTPKGQQVMASLWQMIKDAD